MIKAYKESSAECIALAEIVEKQVKHKYNIYFAYEDMNVVMNILKQNNAEQKNQIFDLNCQIEVLIDKRNSNRYRVMVKESIGHTAYCFSTPIYNDTTKTLVQSCFAKSNFATLPVKRNKT